MNDYLIETELCDWKNEEILRLSDELKSKSTDKREYAVNAFYWVRDNVLYSTENPSNWTASNTLKTRSGNCYTKSNLLVALCRANHIPARFKIQLISGKALSELVSWDLKLPGGKIKHSMAQIYLDKWLDADCTRDGYLPGAYEWDGRKSTPPHPYLIKYVGGSEDLEILYKEMFSVSKNPFKRIVAKYLALSPEVAMSVFFIGVDETRFIYSGHRTLSESELESLIRKSYESCRNLSKIKHPGNAKVPLFAIELGRRIVSVPAEYEEKSASKVRGKAIGEHPFNDWRVAMEVFKGFTHGINPELKFDYEIYGDHVDITIQGDGSGHYYLSIIELIAKIIRGKKIM